MKKLYFLLLTILTSSISLAQVINEIDPDTPGTDMAEFIEIKWTPNTALDGLVVVLYNGSNDMSYSAFDLDGKSTDANGFFIIGNTSIITPADTDLGPSNALQNGADAVALYTGNDTDFPSGTAVTSTNILSAIVYDSNDADDTGLLTGLGETVQYNERENSAQNTESIQRNTDGTYTTKAVTFRQENDAATCDISITGSFAVCDAITTGIDNYTASFNYTGGATSTFTITPSAGAVGGDDPDTVAAGTITVTGLTEGTDVTITITDTSGLCNIMSTETSPICEPAIDLPLYEGFDYTVGANLGDQTDWTNSNSGDEILINSGSLSYPDIEVPTGESVAFDANGFDPFIEFTEVSSGTVYSSFIFSVTDQTAITDLGDGGYFAVLGNFDARLWVRPNPDAMSTTFDIGFGNGSSNPPFTTSTYNVGDNIFVVMSYETGTGALNLWVNPAPSDLGGSAPTALMSDTDATPSATLNQFLLRQDSAGETPAIVFDELRIGTSWADVTPNTLSTQDFTNTNFSIYPNPTNTGFVNITTTSNEAVNVSVFDILGKQIISQTLNNNRLNVSDLNSGVYIIKLTQNGATATKKLVVK